MILKLFGTYFCSGTLKDLVIIGIEANVKRYTGIIRAHISFTCICNLYLIINAVITGNFCTPEYKVNDECLYHPLSFTPLKATYSITTHGAFAPLTTSYYWATCVINIMCRSIPTASRNKAYIDASLYQASPHQTAYKNHRNSGEAGPSRKRSVGISLALIVTPSLRSLLRLSKTIYRPKRPAITEPVAPNAPTVISAGMYFGLSCSRKTLLETTPIRFASGTPILVSRTRRPSCAMLLLYQVLRRTEGAEVPQVIMKVAK